MLVKKCPVEPFDEAVRLRSLDPSGAMFDAFELEEQVVGMTVGSATELAPVVLQHRGDHRTAGLEGG